MRASTLSAAGLTLLIGAALTFIPNRVGAQTMGEYGTVTAQAAGAGESAARLPAPAAHMNPIGSSGDSKTVQVGNEEREDDSDRGAETNKNADDSAGDDWSQVTEDK